MFFDSWSGILRILIVGTLAYSALIALLRISGKRTLSKMNAFDLVVTVALGSTFATVVLSTDVALAEGVTAFAVLIALQYIVAWLSLRSKIVRQFVKSEPRLLLYRGAFLHRAMHDERVTEGEVRAAIRGQGITAVGDVDSVVLETDGTLSVVQNGTQDRSALHDVRNQPPQTTSDQPSP